MSFLVNCGGNDSKKVVTNPNPNNCVGSHCPTNPGVHGEGSYFFNIKTHRHNSEAYRGLLKNVFKVCDRPQITINPDYLLESLVWSGIQSSTTRCSKMDELVHIEAELVSSDAVRIQYVIESDFGQEFLLFDKVLPLSKMKDGHYAHLKDDNGRFSNISFEFYGNIFSDQVELDLVYYTNNDKIQVNTFILNLTR